MKLFHSPYKNPKDTSDQKPGTVVWEIHYGELGSAQFGEGTFARLCAVDKVLGVPCNQNILGIDLTTGKLLWRTPVAFPFKVDQLASIDHHFYAPALNPDDILPEEPSHLLQIDPLQGDLVTLYETDGEWLNRPVSSGVNLILVTHRKIAAINRYCLPEIRWELDLHNDWLHPPVVGEDVLLLCSPRLDENGYCLLAVDPHDGKERWQIPLESALPHPPIIAEDLAIYHTVYQTKEGHLSACHLRNGKPAWNAEILHFGQVYSQLYHLNGYFYFAAQGNSNAEAPDHYVLYAHKICSGEQVWKLNLPGRVQRLAAYGTDHILAASDNGFLICLNSRRQILFQTSLTTQEDPFVTEILVHKGLALLGTRSGRILAVKLESRILFDENSDEYQQVKGTDRELDMLLQFTGVQPEEWALIRLAELARKAGRFYVEGDAYLKLDKFDLAGQAYHRAAVQAESNFPDQKHEIAYRYTKARDAYQKAYNSELVKICEARYRFILKLPQIILDSALPGNFIEGQLNEVILKLMNIGFGDATQIQIKVTTQRFEVAPHPESQLWIDNIPPNGSVECKISLRPLENQIGEAVPLIVGWQWGAHNKECEEGQERLTIQILTKADPAIITKDPNSPASYYQIGKIIITGGGDNLEGGQKGDNVIVNRGGSMPNGLPSNSRLPVPVPTQTGMEISWVDIEENAIRCPICGVPVNEKNNFCNQCGNPISIIN